MNDSRSSVNQTRREFLCSSASGLGGIALAALLQQEGILASPPPSSDPEPLANPLAPRPPHFAPKARSCIYIYMEGAPSQLDLFDPKPRLRDLDGQLIPQELVRGMRFA